MYFDFDLQLLMALISNCAMMPAWHQRVPMSGDVEEQKQQENCNHTIQPSFRFIPLFVNVTIILFPELLLLLFIIVKNVFGRTKYMYSLTPLALRFNIKFITIF